MKLIKRYKNRRLYDTQLKKAIRLKDIKSYVDKGVQVKVIDNATGKDITVQTLVTVLSSFTDDEKSLTKNKSIIEKLWQKEGVSVMDAMKKLMLAAIGAVNLSKEKVEELFDELVKKGEMTTNEKAEAMKKMADKIQASTGKIKDTFETKITPTIEKLNISGRIDELNKKVDELAARLEEMMKKMEAK